MRARIRVCVTLAATAVGLGSCGDDGSSSGGGGGALDEAVELHEAMARANCRQLHTCCSAGELTPRPFAGATEAECVSKNVPFAEAVRTFYGESVTAGRIVFHAEQARACIAALELVSCTASDAQIDCDRYPIWEPRVPPGGACKWSEDCVDGWCDRDLAADEPLGNCIATLPNGAVCDQDRDCASGNCEFGYPDSHCGDLHADGGPCDFDAECASGNCVCADVQPGRVDCLGATGSCAPATENGCALD
jgi:hypothetical protein